MIRETDFLVQSMFERENLDEMTLDELQALAQQYPYSSIVHFLHTSKLKETFDRHFPEAVSHTALYFNNPHWLDYQLSDENERGMIKKFSMEENEEVSSISDPLAEDQKPFNLNSYPVTESYGSEEVDIDLGPYTHVEKTTEVYGDIEDEIETIEDSIVESNVDDDDNSGLGDIEEPAFSSTYTETEADIEENEESIFTQKEEDIIPSLTDLTETSTLNPSQESLDKTSEGQSIEFDPYHTVDYFASQGIKLVEKEDTDDLGLKVKSFTAWLKTMKKLQPIALNASENSISGTESTEEPFQKAELIVTEAMAEVYLKQGMAEKAIDVYTKLSLQNPSNSHIFANRILAIKQNRL